MYRYEMHSHTTGCSACGVGDCCEMVDGAIARGYTGIVFTNHFFQGNTRIDRSLSWEQFVDAYETDWKRAHDYAADKDFDVLFGVEEVYAPGKEVLIYGLSPAVIKRSPHWQSWDQNDEAMLQQLSSFVRENGGFIAAAHPFRERWYIPEPDKAPDPALLDGVEVYNYYNSPENNQKALTFARRYGLCPVSGGDAHFVDALGFSGVDLPERARTGEDLVRLLKQGKYRVIVHGESVDLDKLDTVNL